MVQSQSKRKLLKFVFYPSTSPAQAVGPSNVAVPETASDCGCYGNGARRPPGTIASSQCIGVGGRFSPIKLK